MFERFMICIVSFHMVCRLRYTPSACIRRAPDVQSFLSSSVKSYLRSNLTADYRTSPVPAILHFLSIFITFIYRCSRDLWSTMCPLRYIASSTKSLEHPYYILHFSSILHSSVIHPVYFFCVFLLCIQACIPAPIPFYIFGHILPSVQSYRGF